MSVIISKNSLSSQTQFLFILSDILLDSKQLYFLLFGVDSLSLSLSLFLSLSLSVALLVSNKGTKLSQKILFVCHEDKIRTTTDKLLPTGQNRPP
jgi:hypothetical protein